MNIHEKCLDNINSERISIKNVDSTCEVISLSDNRYPVTQKLIFVPGLAGDTLEEFGSFSKSWINNRNGLQVIGILHSGIIANQENHRLTAGFNNYENEIINGENRAVNNGRIIDIGVTPTDWIQDVKNTIISMYDKQTPITLVGHSFGGIFTLIALAELIEEGKIDYINSQIKFITISTPFYYLNSLPDRKPLRNTDVSQSFTYYTGDIDEKMGDTDTRIPMSSKYSFHQIWDYLNGNTLIFVNRDKDLFNNNLENVFNKIEKASEILGKSDIEIISMTPLQDRWVSRNAVKDFKQMVGREIVDFAFDLPAFYYPRFKETNTHNLTNVWAQYIERYI